MNFLISLNKLLFISIIIIINISCSREKDKANEVKRASLNSHHEKAYSRLILYKTQTLASSYGTKSVLFNSTGTKLYAMNLESMSICEFEEAPQKMVREFKFKPKKATGWNYQLNKSISSYEEKPVEACFSHHDKVLWVSLHNAAGIVPIIVDSLSLKTNISQFKRIYTIDLKKHTEDTLDVPFIKTGKTPKVIAKTADSKYLLVSNWHSHTISVLQINDTIPPYGKIISTIPVCSIPRGIAVDDKNNKSYIAIMGSNKISVINNKTWKIEKDIKVANNPRHIVMDTSGHLFVSFNSLAQIACIDAVSGTTLFKAATHTSPGTIVLSKDKKFLFVTCYSGNTLDVFNITKNSFIRIYSFHCYGKPVGIDLYEDEKKLEAWVCNYTGGNLKVFSFKKI